MEKPRQRRMRGFSVFHPSGRCAGVSGIGEFESLDFLGIELAATFREQRAEAKSDHRVTDTAVTEVLGLHEVGAHRGTDDFAFPPHAIAVRIHVGNPLCPNGKGSTREIDILDGSAIDFTIFGCFDIAADELVLASEKLVPSYFSHGIIPCA